MNEKIHMCNAPDFGQASCYDGDLSSDHLKELEEVRSRGWCSNKYVQELSSRGLIYLIGMHWPSYGDGPLVSYALTKAGEDFITERSNPHNSTCHA